MLSVAIWIDDATIFFRKPRGHVYADMEPTEAANAYVVYAYIPCGLFYTTVNTLLTPYLLHGAINYWAHEFLSDVTVETHPLTPALHCFSHLPKQLKIDDKI